MLKVQCLVLAAYEKRVQDCHPEPWKPRSQQGSERSQDGEAEEPTHMAVGRSLRASSRRSGTQCSSSLQPFQKGTWARGRQVWVAGKGTHSLQPVFPVGQPFPHSTPAPLSVALDTGFGFPALFTDTVLLLIMVLHRQSFL